eukprot:CFRG8005T1
MWTMSVRHVRFSCVGTQRLQGACFSTVVNKETKEEINRIGLVVGVERRCRMKHGKDEVMVDNKVLTAVNFAARKWFTDLNLLSDARLGGLSGKNGESIVVYPKHPKTESRLGMYTHVALTGLGDLKSASDTKAEEDDGVETREESVRIGVAKAVKQLRSQKANKIHVECMGHPEAAGEGASLGLYTYDVLKHEQPTKRKKPTVVDLFVNGSRSALPALESAWERGIVLGEAQNHARRLMDTPANLMTPTLFALEAKKLFLSHDEDYRTTSSNVGRNFRKTRHWTEEASTKNGKPSQEKSDSKNYWVDVREYGHDWALNESMGAFLGVAKGSTEPLKFLEIEYVNGVSDNSRPVVMVGKGVTFDSGGISIKPSANMGLMKADMGGAACVLGAMYGLHRLGVKGRFIACIPLCENMPAGNSLKPGDVVTARNGITIEVDNTDAEGRLILCDALNYAEETYNPSAIVSVATLTGAMDVALGASAAGVFCKSNKLWDCLNASGYATGERLWRMPTFKHYTVQMKSDIADLINAGNRSAGACTAAAFLRKFVSPNAKYAHIDIAGVMHSPSGNKMDMASPYLSAGMQGRPTRALVAFCKKWTAAQ